MLLEIQNKYSPYPQFIVLEGRDGVNRGKNSFYLKKKKSENDTRPNYSKGLCLIHLYVPQNY